MPSSSADERFHTPRNSARRAGYASSEDERFTTPRGATSSRSLSSDYDTPRCDDYTSNSYSSDEQEPFYSGRDDAEGSMMQMPFVAETPYIEEYYYAEEQKDVSTSKAYGQEVSENDVADIFSLARHNKVMHVEDLLDQGIPVNVRDNHGNTILSIACQNGLKKMAKAALRRGADINARNYRGNTPLHFCFAYGYGDTLGEYLISKGGDVTIKNNNGSSAIN